MEWGSYDHYLPLTLGLPSDMSRATALAEFEHLMSVRPERRPALEYLLDQNGIQLDTDDASISTVNEWFVEKIKPYPENLLQPDPCWYGVILDLSLFLGDVMIERNEGLHWDVALWGGKRNARFQRAVGAGFPPLGMNIFFDVDLRLAAYGMTLVQGRSLARDKFVTWLSRAHSMATSTY